MIRFSIIIPLLSALQGQDKGRKAYESGKYNEARAYYEHVLNNRKNDDRSKNRIHFFRKLKVSLVGCSTWMDRVDINKRFSDWILLNSCIGP